MFRTENEQHIIVILTITTPSRVVFVLIFFIEGCILYKTEYTRNHSWKTSSVEKGVTPRVNMNNEYVVLLNFQQQFYRTLSQ